MNDIITITLVIHPLDISYIYIGMDKVLAK